MSILVLRRPSVYAAPKAKPTRRTARPAVFAEHLLVELVDSGLRSAEEAAAEREACAALAESMAGDMATEVPVEGGAALAWFAAKIRARGQK